MEFSNSTASCVYCQNYDICKYRLSREQSYARNICPYFSKYLTCSCSESVFPTTFKEPTLRELIKKVSEKDSIDGTLPSNFVIEECAELITEMANTYRPGKSDKARIFKEACDVLTTVFVLLYSYGFKEDDVKQSIIDNCKHVLEEKEHE